jgi:lipoic acid synthetase
VHWSDVAEDLGFKGVLAGPARFRSSYRAGRPLGHRDAQVGAADPRAPVRPLADGGRVPPPAKKAAAIGGPALRASRILITHGTQQGPRATRRRPREKEDRAAGADLAGPSRSPRQQDPPLVRVVHAARLPPSRSASSSSSACCSTSAGSSPSSGVMSGIPRSRRSS